MPNDSGAEAALDGRLTQKLSSSLSVCLCHTLSPKQNNCYLKTRAVLAHLKKKKKSPGRDGWVEDRKGKMEGVSRGSKGGKEGRFLVMERCERSRRRRKGMMSSFNPIPLVSPPSCFLHRFLLPSSPSLSSRTIFRVMQLLYVFVCVLMQGAWHICYCSFYQILSSFLFSSPLLHLLDITCCRSLSVVQVLLCLSCSPLLPIEIMSLEIFYIFIRSTN